MPFQGILGTEGFLDRWAVTFNRYHNYFQLDLPDDVLQTTDPRYCSAAAQPRSNAGIRATQHATRRFRPAQLERRGAAAWAIRTVECPNRPRSGACCVGGITNAESNAF